MPLLQPTIVAPDSSHWAKWIDGARAGNHRALSIYARMIERGAVPLLSFHHLEELLDVEDDSARCRISFLQNLPHIAWLRLPSEQDGIGSIVQVLAAEVCAASEGHSDLIAIRDRARELLINFGSGRQALGEDQRAWEDLRHALRARGDNKDLIAAFSPLQIFDENRMIGELYKGRINSAEQIQVQIERIRGMVLREAVQSTGGKIAKAHLMADAFMRKVVAEMPSSVASVRDLLIGALVKQGVDESEIRDDCILADLSRLGVFRSQLRVIASKTGRSFEKLKTVPLGKLPSRLIIEALKRHGQVREKRPGSDVVDGHLAVLSAYCSVLYVDKRTAEDFRRVRQKEPYLNDSIGKIVKAATFDEFLSHFP